MQEGKLRLLNAVREYDESKGAPFERLRGWHHAEDLFRSEGGSVVRIDPLNQSMSIDRPV